MSNLSLSEILGVEEGVAFKLIGLKGHYPEELYTILDNKLFSLNNLSDTTTLSEIFTGEYDASVLISIPLDGSLGCDGYNDCDENVNKIGFRPNKHKDENKDGDNCESALECEECTCNYNNDTDVPKGVLKDAEKDLAIEYLYVLYKYTDFEYITRDKKDGNVCVHTYMPYLELENTPDEFWDSIARVKEIIPKELFSFLETTHYYEIEQLLT